MGSHTSIKTVLPMKPGASIVIVCILQLAVVIASPIPVKLEKLYPSSAENSPVNSPRRQLKGNPYHQHQQDSSLHHQNPARHQDLPRHHSPIQHQTRPNNGHHPPTKGLNPYAEPFVPVSTRKANHDHAGNVPFTLAANHDEIQGIQTFLSKQKTDYLKSIGVNPSMAKEEPAYAMPKPVYQRLRGTPSRSSSEGSHRNSDASQSGNEEVKQSDVSLSTKTQESISSGNSGPTSTKHQAEHLDYQGEHYKAGKDHYFDHDKVPQHTIKIRTSSPQERSPIQSPRGSPSYHTPPQSPSPSDHSAHGSVKEATHFVDAPGSSLHAEPSKPTDSDKSSAADLAIDEAAKPFAASSSGKKKNRRGQGKRKAKVAAAKQQSLNRQDQEDFDKILDEHIEKHREEYKTPPPQEESDGSDDSKEKAIIDTTTWVGKLYLREKAQLRRQMANPGKYKNVAEKIAAFDEEEGQQKMAQKVYEKAQIERLAKEHKISHAEARIAYRGYKKVAQDHVAHQYENVQSPFGEGTLGDHSVPVTIPMFYKPSKSKASKAHGKEASTSAAAESQGVSTSAASTSGSLSQTGDSSQKKGKSKKTTPAGKKKNVVNDEDDKIMEEFKAKHEEEAKAQALTPDQQTELIRDAVATANKGMQFLGLKAEARRKRLSKDPKRHRVEIHEDAERRLKTIEDHLEMSKVIQKHFADEAMANENKVDSLKAEDLHHHINQIYGAKVMAEAQDHLISKKVPQKKSS